MEDQVLLWKWIEEIFSVMACLTHLILLKLEKLQADYCMTTALFKG